MARAYQNKSCICSVSTPVAWLGYARASCMIERFGIVGFLDNLPTRTPQTYGRGTNRTDQIGQVCHREQYEIVYTDRTSRIVVPPLTQACH